MITKFKLFENGKIWIEIYKPNYNPTTYDMMKNKKTINLIDNISGKDYRNYIIKRYLAKPERYKDNIYYHINCGSGESGVGRGLYLGKDKWALKNFYDCEKIGYKVYRYIGNPNWLNLMDYTDYEKFEKLSIKNYGKLPYNDNLKKQCLSLDYDGIIYFDPQATGEEYVLFNTNKLIKK